MNTTVNTSACAIAAASAPTPASAEVFVHKGLCEASAAATLDAQHFIVADDEKNTLWMYDRALAEPVASVDLWKFLDIAKKDEADIEAGAHDRKSHRLDFVARAKQTRRNRAEPPPIFCLGVRSASRQCPNGQPGRQAVHAHAGGADLGAPKIWPIRLASASKLAPKKPGALNFEGLAETPEGTLLIGLRNPVREGKALVIPLNNPAQLIDSTANGQARASFGDAIELDLQGRGMRSIERVSDGYYIVAGPIDDEGAFDIYRWSGKADAAPVRLHLPILDGLRPESLIVPAAGKIQILSDDGRNPVKSTACKDLPKEAHSFRSVTFEQ